MLGGTGLTRQRCRGINGPSPVSFDSLASRSAQRLRRKNLGVSWRCMTLAGMCADLASDGAGCASCPDLCDCIRHHR